MRQGFIPNVRTLERGMTPLFVLLSGMETTSSLSWMNTWSHSWLSNLLRWEKNGTQMEADWAGVSTSKKQKSCCDKIRSKLESLSSAIVSSDVRRHGKTNFSKLYQWLQHLSRNGLSSQNALPLESTANTEPTKARKWYQNGKYVLVI